MAQIGSLGKLITFEVSSQKVMTFSGMQQSIKGRWTTHAPIGKKPIKEFLGPDTRTISLQIKLNASLGVKPRSVLTSIENAVENGTPLTFVIAGKKIGTGQWIISSASETWGVVLSKGELVTCNLQLNLEEY